MRACVCTCVRACLQVVYIEAVQPHHQRARDTPNLREPDPLPPATPCRLSAPLGIPAPRPSRVDANLTSPRPRPRTRTCIRAPQSNTRRTGSDMVHVRSCIMTFNCCPGSHVRVFRTISSVRWSWSSMLMLKRRDGSQDPALGASAQRLQRLPQESHCCPPVGLGMSLASSAKRRTCEPTGALVITAPEAHRARRKHRPLPVCAPASAHHRAADRKQPGHDQITQFDRPHSRL